MAQLFKKNIVKEKIQSYEIADFDRKIEVLKNWYNLHKNGSLKAKKEEELEGPFGADFFGKILDYSSFGENEIYNRKFQPKVPEGGQKADIGLGFFGKSKEVMKVVVELKDAKTSLDKPQQRAGNLTPVQQAFKYKPYFKDCDFIIVSNFIEIRLYIDSYYDYEAWTLDDLIDPKDNYFNFRRFYYLLNKQNLITKSGESNTKSLLSLIRIQEKEITKQFYKEYTILRKELFKDIVANNPGFKKTELDFLLNKTQKIIDRIIFIHFCEDKNLLPNGKLKENILRAEEIGFTPWEMLKKFFEFVNSGSDKLGIPDGYNGGMFKSDEELNKLKVGDKICKKFVDLGEYDFEDDLSVNILGHIFEQSISDIEELKDKINKQEEATLSKRKKDGVFYTPEYIAQYIVKNSVGKKIDEWEEELKEKHNLKEDITDKNYEKRAILVYEELQQKVQNIKVLDPACGSGAFLVKVFDFLLDKNKEISKKLDDLGVNQGFLGLETHFKSILQNNIYGVDLNEESVEITKLSLWLKTAQKGKKLANLDSNIKCGNSLIDDKEIAGNKAFVWETEFKEIFDNSGFDVVVGNPPYVFARDNFNKLEKEYYINKYISSKYQINTYILFIEKSVKLLNKGGLCGLIVPNSWLMVYSGELLRKFLLDNTSLKQIINLEGYSFEDANVETVILLLNKQIDIGNQLEVYLNNGNEFYLSHKKYQKDFLNNEGLEFKVFLDDESSLISKKIINNSKLLDDLVNIKAGLKAYEKGKGEPKQSSDDVKNRIYDYNYKFDENTYKYLEGKDVGRYNINFSNSYLKYGKHLAAPRTFNIFNSNKIILREITGKYPKSLISVYTEEIYLFNMSNIAIIEKENSNISLKYINILLNSSLISYYFIKNTAKSVRRLFPKIILNDLRKFPIKNISLSEQKPFIEKADFMLDKNKELQEKVNKFLKRLNSSFDIEKLSKKLEAFYNLEFSEFVKELKKKKVELSLKDQDEWEEYFDSYKKEILELKSQIDTCDKEIDEMVFELYGLSDEEREVVLGSN